MSEDVFYRIGERARYRECGKAIRQAQRRLVSLASPAATEADWRVYSAVFCMTISYSKLDDWVKQADIAKYAGLSARQVRRSLRRLAERGVIVFRPGRGAGVLTVVGFPPEGMKAAEWQATLGLPPVSAFSPPKADRAGARESGHPRARTSPEEPRSEGLGLEERLEPRTLFNSSGGQQFPLLPSSAGAYDEPEGRP